MKFISKLKNILFHPNAFWSDVYDEKGIKETLVYLIILMNLSAILYFLIVFISLNFAKSSGDLGLPVVIRLLGNTISVFFPLFLGTFLTSALLHLFIKMFKGKGTFAETYKAVGYSVTPKAVGYIVTPFSWLMGMRVVNLFILIYGLYLQSLGVSKLHQISMGKAILASVLADIIIYVPLSFLIAFGMNVM
ncbi:MAG: Yip1 family protein [Candidatus Woesearchaeota archaeon]|nr:Yip1 family protein [Candidatus Woesearchaeota archaeon]